TGKDLLFIAGGIGLAPLRSLIQYSLIHREQFGRLILLYGARQPAELMFGQDIQQWEQSDNFEIQLTVDVGDDQWSGRVALIPELIGPLKLDAERTVAVVVGPPVMYRFVIEQLNAKSIPPERIILSLERHMRCGVGKCGHCMIDNLYCCIDGPVFRYSQIVDITGAI
ncbi:MAG: FAD/NAD(P)-binding protein, partial [Planctomycetota bacterium]